MSLNSLFGTAGLRQRLDVLLASAQTRLELLTVELQEEKLRLARLLLGTVLAALLLGFSVLLAAVWITVALWDTHRLLALGASTLVTFALGLGAAGVAARALAAGSNLFGASLRELERDREALGAAPRRTRPAESDSARRTPG